MRLLLTQKLVTRSRELCRLTQLLLVAWERLKGKGKGKNKGKGSTGPRWMPELFDPRGKNARSERWTCVERGHVTTRTSPATCPHTETDTQGGTTLSVRHTCEVWLKLEFRETPFVRFFVLVHPNIDMSVELPSSKNNYSYRPIVFELI